MLQSVGLEYGTIYHREVTTDVNTGSEIELLISPFAAFNNTTATTNNASDSTVNGVLNHHWTFYIEVGTRNFYGVLDICYVWRILVNITEFKYSLNISIYYMLTSSMSPNINIKYSTAHCSH